MPVGTADGVYAFTLPTSSVTDTSANPALSTPAIKFLILTGDANNNGTVDTADFTLLAQHFNASSAPFSQGDFNRDGKVNGLDFNALATNFGKTLTLPPALPMLNNRGDLFNSTGIKELRALCNHEAPPESN